MNEFLDKLSSYNILNYLFPGVAFIFLLEMITGILFEKEPLFTLIFIYYFVGLTISRVGSLIIEPILVKVKFIQLSKYSDFIAASREDLKLETLLEVGNVYRTVTAMFFLLLISSIVIRISVKTPALSIYFVWVAVIMITLLFLFSYKKQVVYITKRVKEALKVLNR